MAMAGYNPNASVAFWERMEQQNKTSTPGFLSTHPVNSTRIAKIKKELPEAMKYYKGAR
jgi:predicted Zn-dependent protease